MLKTYKYRIMPSDAQASQLEQHFGACRLVWNLALAAKMQAWQSNRIILSRFDLQKQLVDLKQGYSWLYDVNSQSLVSVLLNLDNAFKRMYKGNGFPKFKNKHRGSSFQCPGNARKVNWEESTISIPFIKGIRAILSRRFTGKIKTVTILRTPTGKYFASILVETDQVEKIPTKKQNAIGIDLGIKDFAVISTGEKIENPKHLGSAISRLKVLQKRASRKMKGGNNRKKTNLKVAILHEKIANRRNDFLHKVSSRLIGDSQTDTICLETLAVKNMVKNHKLAQAISDVSWSEFVRQLEYKGKWYGKNIIKIDRFYASSKTCSTCGHKKDELNLSERTWDCSNCGANHDRDINAAINIRNSGMGSPGEPVELPTLVGAKKQESMPIKEDKPYL